MSPPNGRSGPGRPPLRQSDVDSHPQRTHELSLFDDSGAARRDAGAELAEDAVHTSWRLAAEAAITDLARAGDFTSDDLHTLVGPPPGHASAVGAVILAAARRKEIVPVGFQITSRPEGHARPVRVWRAA